MKYTPRPLSPALIGLSGIVIGLCFVALGYAFVRDISPRDLLGQATMQAEPSQKVLTSTNKTPDTLATSSAFGVSASTTRLAERLFQDMPFRFIKIVESPDELYTYLIATDRAEIAADRDLSEGVKKNNDTLCGSRYSEKTCYLFREGTYNVNANPLPRLITTWEGPGAFGPNTAVRFTKKAGSSFLEFTTLDGDAGCSLSADHQVNLQTGEHTLLREKTTCVNE